jgi:serpin B
MKRIDPLLSLLLLFVVLASCKKSDPLITPGKGKDLVLSSVGLQKAAADNAFTFNLFKTVKAADNSNNNLFISPLSVGFAVGMTSNGSNGQTLDAIKTAMNYNGFSQDEINSYYNQLITDLPQLDPNATLKIANSIWYKQGFNVLPDFLQTNSTYYNAKIQALDFGNPSSVSTINNWVSNQTNGKIPKIVDQLNAGDIMYLINAMYFKSIWSTKFDAAKTHKMPFNLNDNSQVQADFMKGKIPCKLYADDSVKVAELPYYNSKYSMVIVEPNSGISVNAIVPTLNATKWQNWTDRLSPATADVLLPKFKFSYDVTLNNALSTLGMGIAFSPEADFTRINASGGLSISAVKQKAYVDVDETGTEAAAVTVVVVTATAVLNPQFTADRPFIFAIREIKTGLILFAGIMNNPLQN